MMALDVEEYRGILLKGYGLPVVQLRAKDSAAFSKGVTTFRERLAGKILYSKLKQTMEGETGFFVVEMDAAHLKEAAAEIACNGVEVEVHSKTCEEGEA